MCRCCSDQPPARTAQQSTTAAARPQHVRDARGAESIGRFASVGRDGSHFRIPHGCHWCTLPVVYSRAPHIAAGVSRASCAQPTLPTPSTSTQHRAREADHTRGPRQHAPPHNQRCPHPHAAVDRASSSRASTFRLRTPAQRLPQRRARARRPPSECNPGNRHPLVAI